MGCSWLLKSLLAGTAERGRGGKGATLAAVVGGPDSGWDTEEGDLADWLSSSVVGLSNAEISTMEDGATALVQQDRRAAVHCHWRPGYATIHISGHFGV